MGSGDGRLGQLIAQQPCPVAVLEILVELTIEASGARRRDQRNGRSCRA